MKIQILMSAYNGSPYIQTQLDSIAHQDVEVKSLLIRDDGSSDGTLSILQEYQKKHSSWVSCFSGNNIGVQRSFLELLLRADSDADYVALADQDDEWLPDKLSSAISCLRSLAHASSVPLLYCSDKIIVDENLRPLKVTVSRPIRRPSFGNALVQCICTGCTAVANRALVELIKKYPPRKPEDMIMHDWWLYLTASCFGRVYYDPHAHIRYRQHGKNTSGAMLNRRALMCYRIRELKKPRGEIYRQARLFKETYRELLKSGSFQEELGLIDRLLSSEQRLRGKLKVVCDPRYYRQKRSDDMVFRGITLIGKL